MREQEKIYVVKYIADDHDDIWIVCRDEKQAEVWKEYYERKYQYNHHYWQRIFKIEEYYIDKEDYYPPES